MTAKSRVSVLLAVLLLFGLGALWSCGTSGGDDNTPDPGAVRPTITGLSRNSANIGDQVVVYGLNFGTSQSSGNVRLNGLDFVVNDWTETVIDVTVAQGMVSGIVVVTVAALSSQSGPEAQLFIPAAPTGRPLINAVVPGYGDEGDEILISGSYFGPPGAGGQVFFVRQSSAVSQAGTPVLAEVVTIDVDGTSVPKWGAAAIEVKVPLLDDLAPGRSEVYVLVNGEESNHKGFTVLPPPWPVDAPVIETVEPSNGQIGTAITISGDKFGHTQSGSIAELGDVSLTVVTWSNTIIQALIPEGAVSGKIRVTVNGKPSNEVDFIVANTPVITGVSPYEVRVGDPFEVTGYFFGSEQGTGALRIGGTSQTIETWNDTRITVAELSPINASGDQIEVIVTADNGLSSEPAYVELVSDLEVRVTVDPTAGQRNDQTGQGGTPFAFTVSVAGGSGSYEFHLIPDGGSPSSEAPTTSSNVVTYTYPFESGAPDEKYYDTMMRVVDTDSQDSITVNGPTVLVVNPGVPVITKIALNDFNRGGIEAPNDWCYLADGSYYDFTFQGGSSHFTSSVGDVMSGGSPLPSYTRDERAYKSDGNDPRPYAYRYFGTEGSEVLVQGLNFGDMQGELVLNAGDANALNVTAFTSWTNEAITFRMPPETRNLSGTVSVTPLGSGMQANSVKPLICSPYVMGVVPEEVDIDIGTLTVSGFDFEPRISSGMTGGGTYGIWMVRALYDNPFGGGNVTGLVLLTTPIAPASIVGTTMSFPMSSLDVDGNGTVPVEVFNPGGDQSEIVEGTLQEGEYFLFLWTGVLGSGANNEVAASGIFSETYPVQVGSVAPVDDPPNAVLTTDPSPAEADDPPLTVEFDASGSTDDGNITKYEFNFGDGGDWEDYGMTPTAEYTYTADDTTYTAFVRVYDDATPTPQDDIAQVSISIGGGGTGNTITVTVTVNFNGYVGDGVGTFVKVYDSPGGTLVDQDFVMHTDGVPEVVTFEDLNDGTYDVEVNRIVTNWVGFGDIQATQTVTLPPDADVEFTGNQLEDPPPPG